MKLFDWLNEDDDAEPPSSPLLARKLATLKDTPVKKIMRPRALINALDADVQLRRVRRLKSLTTAYLPVFRGDLDSVIGWIPKTRALELLADPSDDVALDQHVRPIGVIDESTPASALADAFLASDSPLLLVKSAAGATTGLLSISDLVEVLFGFAPAAEEPVALAAVPSPSYDL